MAGLSTREEGGCVGLVDTTLVRPLHNAIALACSSHSHVLPS